MPTKKERAAAIAAEKAAAKEAKAAAALEAKEAKAEAKATPAEAATTGDITPAGRAAKVAKGDAKAAKGARHGRFAHGRIALRRDSSAHDQEPAKYVDPQLKAAQDKEDEEDKHIAQEIAGASEAIRARYHLVDESAPGAV